MVRLLLFGLLVLQITAFAEPSTGPEDFGSECERLLRPHQIKGYAGLKELQRWRKSDDMLEEITQLMVNHNGVVEIRITPTWLRASVDGVLKTLDLVGWGEKPRRLANRYLPRPIVLIGNPNATWDVLAHPEAYRRGYDPLARNLGQNSFFIKQDSDPVQAKEWELAHDVMARAFTPAMIYQTYVPIIQNELERLSRTWREELARSSEVKNAQDQLDIFAIRVAFRAFADQDLRAEEALELRPLFGSILAMTNPEEMRQKLIERVSPLLTSRPPGGNKLIDRLMEAQKTQSDANWAMDQLLTLLFAAQETTRFALAMTLIEFADHFEWRERLSQDPKFQEAFVKEVLRLHSPAPMFPRQLLADRQVGPYQFSESSIIQIVPYAQHRLPSLWGENPEALDPERFIPGEGRRPIGKADLCPFGGGARICIGMMMAMTEIKMFVQHVAQHWEVEPLKVRPRVDGMGVLSLQEPLTLTLRPRQP